MFPLPFLDLKGCLQLQRIGFCNASDPFQCCVSKMPIQRSARAPNFYGLQLWCNIHCFWILTWNHHLCKQKGKEKGILFLYLYASHELWGFCFNLHVYSMWVLSADWLVHFSLLKWYWCISHFECSVNLSHRR